MSSLNYDTLGDLGKELQRGMKEWDLVGADEKLKLKIQFITAEILNDILFELEEYRKDRR